MDPQYDVLFWNMEITPEGIVGGMGAIPDLDLLTAATVIQELEHNETSCVAVNTTTQELASRAAFGQYGEG